MACPRDELLRPLHGSKAELVKVGNASPAPENDTNRRHPARPHVAAADDGPLAGLLHGSRRRLQAVAGLKRETEAPEPALFSSSLVRRASVAPPA
jgi:hypothetical protein